MQQWAYNPEAAVIDRNITVTFQGLTFELRILKETNPEAVYSENLSYLW